MIRIKKKLSSRVIAFVTAAVFIICAVPDELFKREAARAAGSSANDNGRVNFPGNAADPADLNHTDSLIDNGDGTFTFTSEIDATYSYSDESKNRAKTQDGYVVLEKAGTYLIELWGGDGGIGAKLPLVNYTPGKAGKGGFVYGTLEVTEEMVGKRIYYEVGSNGKSITRSINDGGSGGIGGGAGSITLISVGAGGGYSAVYLIDKDTELTEEDKNNPEKVLMIAGGGGGGGAGPNLLPRPVGSPDGGNGGTKGSLESDSGVEGFNGKYYAGTDGSSSSKKTRYTGKGGTDRPGEINESVLGFFDSSSFPNDWLMTYHPDGERGAGSAGNLRGGGGGAGFAGGSGGLQKTAIDAEDVGGGGGGSSYLNTEVMGEWDTGVNVDYFTETNTNDKGGSVIIRYIPKQQDAHYYDYLNDNVTISGEISDYFDIAEFKAESVHNGTSVKLDDKFVSISDNNFSLTGLISPYGPGITMGQKNYSLRYSVKLKPKNNFYGGNDVPVFKNPDKSVTVKCVSENFSGKNAVINYRDEVKHVNVPFDFGLSTQFVEYEINSTYKEENLLKLVSATGKQNAFIESVSSPDIENLTATETVTAQQDKTYKVKMSVFPKTDGTKSVGTPNASPTNGISSVFVKVNDLNFKVVDGINIKAQKGLEYNSDSGTYDLSVDMTIKKDEKKFEVYEYDPEVLKKKDPVTIKIGDMGQTGSWFWQKDNKSASYTISEPGFYYIEAYGGSGGSGCDFSEALKNTQNKQGHGGEGGKGGYAAGIICVESSLDLFLSIGDKGGNGEKGKVGEAGNTSGKGGESTYIKIGTDNKSTTYLLVAGGGGGGGKGYSITTGPWNSRVTNYYDGAKGQDGAKNLESDDITDISKDPITFVGTEGKNDGDVESPAAPNYKNPAYFKGQIPDAVQKDIGNFSSDAGRGAVRITKLEVKLPDTPAGYDRVDKDNEEKMNYAYSAPYSKYELDEYISKYFDIVSITSQGVESSFDNKDQITPDGNIPLKFNFNLPDKPDSNNGTVVYPLGKYEIIKKRTYIYPAIDNRKVKVTFHLKPKQGFLGGNDVPLLQEGTKVEIKHSTYTSEITDDTLELEPSDVTDYVNVALDSSSLAVNLHSPPDPVIDYAEGGTSVTAETIRSSISNPASGKTWEADYVADDVEETIINRETGRPLAEDEKITHDTGYLISAHFKPKAPAEKAVVTDEVSKAAVTSEVTVKVRYKVEYDLKYLNCDSSNSSYIVLSDTSSDYITYEISAPDPYQIPEPDKVGVEGAECEIRNENGRVLITFEKSKISRNIKITAAGVKVPHYVYYYYQYYDIISHNIEVGEYKDTYYKGDTITDNSSSVQPAQYPPGYDKYGWTWPDNIDITNQSLKMGDEDIYVVGNYILKSYKLTIKYYTQDDPEGTNKVLKNTYTSPEQTHYDSVTDTFDFALIPGGQYSVKTPDLEGYLPDKVLVAGTVSSENPQDVTVDVIYTKLPEPNEAGGKINFKVYYIKCDIEGNPAEGDILPLAKHVDSYTETDADIIAKQPVDFELYKRTRIIQVPSDENNPESALVDKEIEVSEISGTLSGDDEAVYYVYYRPVQIRITVRFDPDGGSVQTSEKNAVIGREYGYDPESDRYTSLPKAAKTGYIFDGWYLGETLIEEDTIVKEPSGSPQVMECTLKAKWKSSAVTVTVHYKYAFSVKADNLRGTIVHEDIVKNDCIYNMSYSIESPGIAGYVAEPPVLTGIAFSDTEFTVWYKDAPVNPEPGQDPAPEPEVVVLNISVYSSVYEASQNDQAALLKAPKIRGGTFAVYNGGNLIAEVENTTGTISLDGNTSNIQQNQTYIIKCISPPSGYGEYSGEVTLSAAQTNKPVFLDVKFNLPFTGTVNQLIYYCTGAGIMLLAALLLYKTLKKEKTYDKN